jgi:hypothetical protein
MQKIVEKYRVTLRLFLTWIINTNFAWLSGFKAMTTNHSYGTCLDQNVKLSVYQGPLKEEATVLEALNGLG